MTEAIITHHPFDHTGGLRTAIVDGLTSDSKLTVDVHRVEPAALSMPGCPLAWHD